MKSLQAENKIAEENQVTTKDPKKDQVTTKDPKKVEAGSRLAEYNRRNREELRVQKSESKQVLDSSQYYRIGAVLPVGLIGGLGYYLYQAKKGEVNNVVPPQQPRPQTNKFEME